jgi:hypothetical protein
VLFGRKREGTDEPFALILVFNKEHSLRPALQVVAKFHSSFSLEFVGAKQLREVHVACRYKGYFFVNKTGSWAFDHE